MSVTCPLECLRRRNLAFRKGCAKTITFWDAPAWTMLVPKMNGLQDGQRTAFWDSYNHGYKNWLPCSAQP